MYGIFIPNAKDIHGEVLKLDQLNCWRLLLGAHIDLGQKITSPFRSDNDPGCFLQERQGIIRFKDFQQRVLHNADIVDAYSYLYNCSRVTAIGLLSMNAFPPRARIEVSTGSVNHRRGSGKPAKIDIQPFIRNGQPVFTKKHLAFWEERKVSYETLQGWIDHEVFAVHSWALNEDWTIAKKLTFAYKFKNGDTKIYVPGDRNAKFPAGTTKENDIWRWERPGNEMLIVDKSFKDGCHDVRLFPGYDIWVFQSENTLPKEIPDFSKYKKIVLKVDNDVAGAKGLARLLTVFEEGIPMYYPAYVKGVKIKDTDDMVVHGFEDIAKKLMP